MGCFVDKLTTFCFKKGPERKPCKNKYQLIDVTHEINKEAAQNRKQVFCDFLTIFVKTEALKRNFSVISATPEACSDKGEKIIGKL